MSGFAEGVPTVEIQLGGKSYTLGWTWGSKRRFREALVARGTDITEQTGIAENMAAVLWASMEKEARAAMSVEDVEELIHSGNEVEVATKIGELFKVSEPDPEPAGKTEPAAVTGPTAGRSNTTRSAPLESVI